LYPLIERELPKDQPRLRKNYEHIKNIAERRVSRCSIAKEKLNSVHKMEVRKEWYGGNV
jgi:hypothetical protein